MALISVIVRREGTPGNWANAPENKREMFIIQYDLWYNSPMSYDNYTTLLGVCQPNYKIFIGLNF